MQLYFDPMLKLNFIFLPKVGYHLRVSLNDSVKYIPLSHDFLSCHPDWITFSTCPGFVPRDSAIFYDVDSVGKVLFKLPTCCGYVSRTGKWLKSGKFHRFCVMDIDGLRRFFNII